MTHSWQVDGGGDWRWTENWWWWRWVSLFWSGKWKEEAKGWRAFPIYRSLTYLFSFSPLIEFFFLKSVPRGTS